MLSSCLQSLVCLGLIGCAASTTTPRTPLTTSAGVPVGAAVTTSLDATGGSLTSADGRLKLVVAPNTVSAATTFSIEPITSPAPNAVGASYRLEPHGQAFPVPVTVTLQAPEAGVSRATVEGLGPASQGDDGRWTWASNVVRDADAKTLTFPTTHFSDWSLLEGLQLHPLVGTVQEGSTLELEVVSCTQTQEGALTGLVMTCGRDAAAWAEEVTWAVNGQTGGNGTVGTVTGDLATGSFTAPSTRPSPATVAVSATLAGLPARSQVTVISELTIGKAGTFRGPLTVSSTGGLVAYTASGDATLTPAEDASDVTTFDLAVALKVPSAPLTLAPGVECTPTAPTQQVNAKATFTRSPPGFAFALGATWPLSCVSSGQMFSSAIVLEWLTGCAPSTRVSLPVADPNHLEGSYTRSQSACPAGQVVGETTVTWNFSQ
jgi:hypothetical protein